jgi:hypothetical protein
VQMSGTIRSAEKPGSLRFSWLVWRTRLFTGIDNGLAVSFQPNCPCSLCLRAIRKPSRKMGCYQQPSHVFLYDREEGTNLAE